MAGAATIAGRDLDGQSLICGPGSTADNSISCSPNDSLSGVFTNVGLFQINAGTTVFVTPGIPLVVFASTVSISGLLNGSGRGEVGGIGGDPGLPGSDGEGMGPGKGAAAIQGGGGAGYGNIGGIGSGGASSGTAYGLAGLESSPVSPDDINMGSGGGGGGGAAGQTSGSGGQGGASIYLEASSFTLTGYISVRGVPGGNSAKPAGGGGGGAGGSLLLRCMDSATVNGSIIATGGDGGDVAGFEIDDPVYPGGGGGGGRVKIYYRKTAFSVAISTAGGAKGSKSGNWGDEGTPIAQAGSSGTVSFAIVASSPTGLTFPAVFTTSITWSWTAVPNSEWGNAAEASRKYRVYSGTVSYRTPDRSPQLAVSSDTVSATETSLTPNTTYTRYATAFTDYSDSLPSNAVSTHTLANVPGAAASAFTAVAVATLSLNWSAGAPANPGYTSYEVNRSTDINFGINVSTSYVAALSSAPAGLTPNTTYHFRIRAINLDNIPTGFTPIVSTATLAVKPAGPSFAQVSSTSFVFNWNSAGNPPLTRYIAEISTDNFATLVQSSSTLNAGAAFSGLTVNALYYARVKAQNHNGLDTAFTDVITTVTITAQPLNATLPFTNLSADALTFNWKSGGNSAGTNYNPEISTNSNFSSPVSSEVTTNLNYVFTGLSVNTTYYAHVRALGAGGLASLYSSSVSTVTYALAPVTATPPFTGIFASSFTFSWGNGGNPAGTVYTAEISKDGFVNVSGAIQTSALSAAFSALTANTVYQARVKAVNFLGVGGPFSSPIVSTATAISSPVNAAVPFSNLSAGGLTFSWGSGGNGAGTDYNPWISTSSDFSAPVSSDVTTNLNYVFTGLSVNATYYGHVRAIGKGGAPTVYTDTVSTVTYTLAPAVPASPFTNVNTGSFTFSWNTGGNPPDTRYAAEISRDNFVNLIASASTLSLSAGFTGLTPNTVYQARAKAVNFLGVEGPYSSPIRSTATLAMAPSNTSTPFTAVSAAALTFTWAEGGNPGGTSYTVEISSAGFVPGTAISSATTLALSRTFAGLLANTTYYGRVKAVNMDNVPSVYSASVPVVTLPLSPAMASPPFGDVNSSSFTLSWTAGGNPQNTTYVAEISRDNFVTVSTFSTTLNIQAAFTGLTPNTTYTARVKAVNFAGEPGPYSSPIVSTAALAVPPLSAVSSFTLTGDGLTVHWLAGGNPSGTKYEAEISTRPDFALLSASSGVTGLSESFSLAANTTYYARLRARNHNGIPTADLALGGEITYAAQPAVSASATTGLVSVTTFSFTNNVSTGVGGLLFYRFTWDKSATHAWNNQESSWTALGVLTTTATGNGYWYLHLRSYNFKGLGYKTDDVGPFQIALNEVKAPGRPVPAPGPFTAAPGITWNWPPATTFKDAAISSYVVCVGTISSNVNDVNVIFATVTLASLTLAPADDGKTYWVKAKAIDEGGVSGPYSDVSTPGVLVDRTVPGRLGAVQADCKFSYDSNILFSWSASTDPESGIKGYLLDLGTTLNANDIFNAENMGDTLSYQAAGLPSGKSIFARVRAENNAGGTSDYSDPGPGIPVWTLNQAPPMVKPYNWPNPFNPMGGSTQIGFFLNAPAKVTLKLFTLEGDLVYEETHSESLAGNKVWPWAGRNGTGKMVAPGGYICIIEKNYNGKTERQQFKLAVLY